MEDDDELVNRAAIQAHHQTRQNQGDWRQTLIPGNAEHNKPDQRRARQCGELRGKIAAGQRPQRGDGDTQLRARCHAERGRFRQRITQHLLKKYPDQPQACAHQQ